MSPGTALQQAQLTPGGQGAGDFGPGSGGPDLAEAGMGTPADRRGDHQGVAGVQRQWGRHGQGAVQLAAGTGRAGAFRIGRAVGGALAQPGAQPGAGLGPPGTDQQPRRAGARAGAQASAAPDPRRSAPAGAAGCAPKSRQRAAPAGRWACRSHGDHRRRGSPASGPAPSPPARGTLPLEPVASLQGAIAIEPAAVEQNFALLQPLPPEGAAEWRWRSARNALINAWGWPTRSL